MAAKSTVEMMDDPVEETVGQVNRETEWFGDVTPADMIRLPYIYLMNGGGEIDKQFPGFDGSYYLSSVGAPVNEGELAIIPVRVGKRIVDVERNGQMVEEESYRVLALDVQRNSPVMWTLRDTAKESLRVALGGLLLGGPGLRGRAYMLKSATMRNNKRQEWFVPVFEPMDIDPETCRSLCASVFTESGDLQSMAPVGSPAGKDGLPF